ncbi:hypothetical protein Gocc_0024 [Gaiella occulta]|uniref:Uncharacterized protein n=1 Tax=Gaiella occulta TaxID=1002870 RepID=A0A7M2Z0P9_9ACTN|nr:hypothetical protein [Gaiella occulta]RDI75605.1 hypothetical protein Gocc_0024 [Gaiella occulta]
MQFSPAIDARFVRAVRETRDLGCAAEVWRRLRRRARRARLATPCYESTRRLVVAERERRARIRAAAATIADIVRRRIPALPEDVPRMHARHLARARSRVGARRPRSP